jgi:hypothetical protein
MSSSFYDSYYVDTRWHLTFMVPIIRAEIESCYYKNADHIGHKQQASSFFCLRPQTNREQTCNKGDCMFRAEQCYSTKTRPAGKRPPPWHCIKKLLTHRPRNTSKAGCPGHATKCPGHMTHVVARITQDSS